MNYVSMRHGGDGARSRASRARVRLKNVENTDHRSSIIIDALIDQRYLLFIHSISELSEVLVTSGGT